MNELNLSRKSIDEMFNKERRILYDKTQKEKQIEFERTHPKMTYADPIWGIHIYLVANNITKSNKMYLDDILERLNLKFSDDTKQKLISKIIGHRGDTYVDSQNIKREYKPFSTVIYHKKKDSTGKNYTVRMMKFNMRAESSRGTKKDIYKNKIENVHKAQCWIATTDATGFESVNDCTGTRMFDSFKPVHIRRILKKNSYQMFMKNNPMPKIINNYYAFNVDKRLKETFKKLVTTRAKLY